METRIVVMGVSGCGKTTLGAALADRIGAAFIDGEKGEKLWHREFAARGSRPNVATSKAGAVVVWYESSRVRLASINRDGLGEASVLSRVTGYQPHPEIVAGPKPGQWYVAWRDYEAGHLETFVVRAQCP